MAAFDQTDLDNTVKEIQAKLHADADARSFMTKALEIIGTLSHGVVGTKPKLAKADDAMSGGQGGISDDADPDMAADDLDKCEDDGWSENPDDAISKADMTDGGLHVHLHQHQHGPGDDDEPTGDDDDDGDGDGDMGMDDDLEDDEGILAALLRHIDRHGDDDDDDKEDSMGKGRVLSDQFQKALDTDASAVVVNDYLTTSLRQQERQDKRLATLEKSHAWVVKTLRKAQQQQGSQTSALAAIGQGLLKMSDTQEQLSKGLMRLLEGQEERESTPQDSRFAQLNKGRTNGLRQSVSYDKRKASDLLMKGVITNAEHAMWKYRNVMPAALETAAS